MAQLSVPVVSSEPPRPRNRDRSVCGRSLPTQLSLPYRVPSGQFPQWSVVSVGQFPQWSVSPVVSGQRRSVPQWSVSPVVSGQCRSVSPVVSLASGQWQRRQFPQWSVSPVVSGQCRSVSPVVVSVVSGQHRSDSPVQSARLSRHDHSRLCLLRLQHQVGEASDQGSAHDDSDHDARNRAAA